MNPLDLPTCFLFDNGSVRAASTLSLRAAARSLEAAIGAPVRAVSLLHSSGVAAEALGGEPAELLEPALSRWLADNPRGKAVLLPFFFGPSAALTDYVPERLAAVKAKFPLARIELARWLVEPGEDDPRIAKALGAAVRTVIAREKLNRPKVLLVDHGSPQRDVAAVRDHLGSQLTGMLGAEVEAAGVASMERRPGPEFAFNEPLLAGQLRRPPFDSGDVVLALQFLSPGRHAGAGGDIAAICASVRRERPDLRIWMTETIGRDENAVGVLADRYRVAAGRIQNG